MAVKERTRHGARFRLLVYRRMWERWALTCALIVPAALALWWFAPRIPILHAPYRHLALVPGVVALVLLAYTWLAARVAAVQCRAKHLWIRTPFYPLVISYARIKSVRPKPFGEAIARGPGGSAKVEWLRPYWGRTALVVELSAYPLPKGWLRLWCSPYLLSPQSTAFVLLVDDWMRLSRQLDDFRGAWELRRAGGRRAASSPPSRPNPPRFW